MFRSTYLIPIIIIITLMTSFINGANITNTRKRHIASTRKPVSIKICGLALIRMLDMVCTKARQLLIRNGIISSAPEKRQFNIEDDPFSRTISIIDYARKFFFSSPINWHILSLFCVLLEFNNTLIGDCCLQPCTLKTLLKYC